MDAAVAMSMPMMGVECGRILRGYKTYLEWQVRGVPRGLCNLSYELHGPTPSLLAYLG